MKNKLRKLEACVEAVKWCGGRTPRQAYDDCERGDWLLWIAPSCGVDRRLVVRAACACARTALQHVPPSEERPRQAIETAEAWCHGEATLEAVRAAAGAAADAIASATVYAAASATVYAAASAADAAASAAYGAARTAAASAAASAAGAAYGAVRAAAYAAYAAPADADADAAASAATYDAVRAVAHKQCADIVRSTIPFEEYKI